MRPIPILFSGLIVVLCPVVHAGQATPTPAQAAPPAQAAATAAPEFDVAAIHLHESMPHEHNSIWSSPFDGHFKAENITVLTLIHWAYEMPDSRILGAPSWANSTMFNIEASSDPSVDRQLKALPIEAARHQKELMVQALLVARFQLVAHSETRELPVYNLVIARNGATLGSLKESGSFVSGNNGRIEVQMAHSVAVLAEELSKIVGREVIDKTGISGRYDLKLQSTPDDAAPEGGNPVSGSGAPESGPPIFTALQEQLGLQLKSAKGAVTVLVVDHVAMPSAN